MWFMHNAMATPDTAGAGATDYMHLLGLVALGYMWARMAGAAEGDTDFARAKRTTGRFFMERMLPETGLRLARIQAGAETTMALPAEAF